MDPYPLDYATSCSVPILRVSYKCSLVPPPLLALMGHAATRRAILDMNIIPYRNIGPCVTRCTTTTHGTDRFLVAVISTPETSVSVVGTRMPIFIGASGKPSITAHPFHGSATEGM